MTSCEGHSYRRPAAPVVVLTPGSFLVQRPMVPSDPEREAEGGVWVVLSLFVGVATWEILEPCSGDTTVDGKGLE